MGAVSAREREGEADSGERGDVNEKDSMQQLYRIDVCDWDEEETQFHSETLVGAANAGLLGSTALHWAVSSEQGDPDYAADDDKVEGEGASTRGR